LALDLALQRRLSQRRLKFRRVLRIMLALANTQGDWNKDRFSVANPLADTRR
jgi:hypothetical protein